MRDGSQYVVGGEDVRWEVNACHDMGSLASSGVDIRRGRRCAGNVENDEEHADNGKVDETVTVWNLGFPPYCSFITHHQR